MGKTLDARIWLFAMLVALVPSLVPSRAGANAITVLGSSDAHDCFLSASIGTVAVSSLESCRKALAAGDLSSDDHAATYVNMGIILNSLGRIDDALSAFEEALDRKPKLGEAVLSRGNSHFLRRDYDQAIVDYELSIEYGVTNEAAAHFNHGLAHGKMRNFEQAALSYQRALELDPEFPRAQARLERLQTLGLTTQTAPRPKPRVQ